MARNPELNHEFNENKQTEKQKPIIYQAYDDHNDPYEAAVIGSTMGNKSWKSYLLKICGGLAVLALMGFLHNWFTGLL